MSCDSSQNRNSPDGYGEAKNVDKSWSLAPKSAILELEMNHLSRTDVLVAGKSFRFTSKRVGDVTTDVATDATNGPSPQGESYPSR